MLETFLPTWLLLVVLSLVLLLFVKNKRSLNLPPGPRGLPIFGYLPFLSVTKPHLQFDEMRKKYGNVFGMYMGSKYFLILCDIQSTKEAFNRDDYALRPDGRFQISNDFNFFGGTNGQHWVDHRKLATRSLRELVFDSKSFQQKIMEQITMALECFEKQSVESEDGEVNLRDSLLNTFIGISCFIVCGKTYPPDHEVTNVIKVYLKAFAEYITASSIQTYLPWFKPVIVYLAPGKAVQKKAFKDMENYIWKEIDNHEKNPIDVPNDFLYHYLKQRSKPNMGNRFNRPDMNGDAQSLFIAATESSSIVVEWFLLCMAKFTQIQERVYQEIRDQFGAFGLPDYDQRGQTPFTEACIIESLRYMTVAPVNAPHGSPNTVTRFQGYDIPAESVIISNVWSIHNDSQNWSRPNCFYPERFLSEDGTVSNTPECYIPFSTGKRMCIGSKLALKEIYLFVICFLQRFQVLPTKDGVNMDGRMRLGWEPANPVVRLVRRED